jgi:Fuc2NAc and GlcNAc transferase
VSCLVLFTAAVVLVLCAVVTGMVRRFALSHDVMDIPNERSSHTTATPRGGGLSIVLVCTAALVVFAASGVVDSRLLIALVGGGGMVAAIGFLDDRRPMPAALRLAVHIAAAAWAIAWFGGLPAIRVGNLVFSLGWFGYVLGVLGIVWTLNLFNFMDGIDGIAASEAGFVGVGAILLSLHTLPADVAAVTCIFCAASAGFLIWNWPPAKIFMGDVGSGYLGYMIAVLAMAATRDNPVAVWVWLILGGAFFVDATVTLARRSFRGERLHEAHRSHAYQWLARRWGSHRRVTLSVLAVNVCWLLPAAWLAMRYPRFALWSLAGAFAPLIILAIAVGSGRREQPGR